MLSGSAVMFCGSTAALVYLFNSWIGGGEDESSRDSWCVALIYELLGGLCSLYQHVVQSMPCTAVKLFPFLSCLEIEFGGTDTRSTTQYSARKEGRKVPFPAARALGEVLGGSVLPCKLACI